MIEDIIKGLSEEDNKAIESADIVVFEGFDMTGKSTLLHQYHDLNPDTFCYRPDWEQAMNDKVVGRGNRHIPGLAITQFWKDLLTAGIVDSSYQLLIDRFYAVSLVYQEIYHQQSDFSKPEDLQLAFDYAIDNLRVVIIHTTHYNEQEAKVIWEASSKDGDHSDSYDNFDSFVDYYQKFKNFDEVYEKVYNTKLPSSISNVFYVSGSTHRLLAKLKEN